MENLEDAYYIAEIHAGDINAFRFLVNKYKDMAYTLCFSILKNETEAEDAAQESFIKAFKKLRSFNKDSKFSTWLYTIIYRTALYNLRHSKWNLALLPDHSNVIDVDLDQVESLSLIEQKSVIRKAVRSLPKMEGVLITLYYLDENSIQEIEEITGLSKSNIKIKLFRARKKLKNYLAPIMENAQ